MNFMIEYRIKADQKEKAAQLRDTFFAALKAMNDPGFTYRSLSKPDGVSFVHLAWYENEEAKVRFQGIPEFGQFAAGLKEVAEVGPEATPLTEVNSTES